MKHGGRNQSASSAHKRRGYFEERIPREKTFGHAKAVFWGCLIASLAFAVFSFYCQYEFNAAVGNDILRSLAIGVVTLICVAGLYALIMWCYTRYAFSSAQKALVVVGVLVASFVARFVIAVLTTLESTETGVVSHGDISASFVSALYSAFGGLTFEGMDGELSIAVWQAAVYHGVAILAALVFFSSATLALDYPIASLITREIKKVSICLSSAVCAAGAAMQKRSWRAAYKNRKPDVYIFDSITQDSVLLAEDIRRHYQNATEKRQPDRKNPKRSLNRSSRAAEWLVDEDRIAWTMGKRCIIVFCGPECEAYDRKNSLHRRIEANNFLYLRYNFGRDIPIARIRNESTAGYGVVRSWLHTARNIHYFAFNRDESFEEKNGRKYRSEQANAQAVSDELEALKFRIEGAYAKKNKTGLRRKEGLRRRGTGMAKLAQWRWASRVCFYILSENDIDYATYQARLSAYSSEMVKYTDTLFDLKLVNEAERATWHQSLMFNHNLPSKIVTEYADKIVEIAKGGHEWHEVVKTLWPTVKTSIAKAVADGIAREFRQNAVNGVEFDSALARVEEGIVAKSDISEEKWPQLVEEVVSTCFANCPEDNGKIADAGRRAAEDYMMKASRAAAADEAIVKVHENGIVRVLSLGFGDTARKTIGSLYINHDGNMIVDAVDRNVDNIIGAYKRTHPSVLCVPAKSGSGINFGDLEGAVCKGVRTSSIDNVFHADDEQKSMFLYDNLLVINYANRDCLGADVADYIDDCFGGRSANAVKYDAMIIALGNDELNITCFRSVIMDIRHELIRDPSLQTVPTTIFVHIGDKKNAARLYWDDNFDKTSSTGFLKDIRVVPYGFRQSVYTYDEIVDDSSALSMNYWYLKKAGYIESDDVSDKYAKWGRVDCPSLYKKWSSKVAVTFFQKLRSLEDGTRRVLEKAGSLTPDMREFATKALSGTVEHRRWLRFHYVNGYEFADVSFPGVVKERNLVHNMLKKFSDLAVSQQINSHANGEQAAAWEAEHLVEECLQFPSRNLSETEMEFIVAMLEDNLQEIDDGAKGTPNSFMDGLIRALVKCEPSTYSLVTCNSAPYDEDDINQWLTQHGLHEKRAAVELILEKSDKKGEKYIPQLQALRPKEIEDCLAARNISTEKGQATAEFRYEMVLRLLAAAMTAEANGEESEQSNKAITDLNAIIANAIPVELVTLLKRGQLSQEFVCKSGDYENFGAAVRMPDGVTITRREELLRLYYIWKKSKKAG